MEALPAEAYFNDVVYEIFKKTKGEIYQFLVKDAYTPIFLSAVKMSPEPSECILVFEEFAEAIELAVQINRTLICILKFTTPWSRIIEELATESLATKL